MGPRPRPGELMVDENREQPLGLERVGRKEGDGRATLARGADEVLVLHAGQERSVAATKTYTAQLTMLSLLVAHTAEDQRLIRAHEALPDAVASALETVPAVTDAAAHLSQASECLVTSRGYNFATALEAALKLKEGCRMVAEALSSADLLHGPIALVERDFPVIVVAPRGRVLRHLSGVLRRLLRRRARTVVLSSVPRLLAAAAVPVRLPDVRGEGPSPPVYILPLQLLAYYKARLRRLNPDRPQGLRKGTYVL